MINKLFPLALSAALVFGGFSLSLAEDLVIEGLGRMPFPKDVTVTDGGASQLNHFMIAGTHQKDYGKSARAAMWSILTVPPGMQLYPEKAPYPYDSMHMYQIRKTDVRGTYSAGIYVISGTEKDFFHEGHPKAARFWATAFREDAERPTSLFGMPKIQTSEFQALVDHVLSEKKGPSMQVKILKFVPWRAFKNEDGTYRWGQEAKVILTNEKGLSFPLWISANLLKAGDKYYLIEVNGSHAAADQLSNLLLYGFYRIKR